MATERSNRVSCARYTSPIPPEPRGERISYGPNRVPGARGIGSVIITRAVEQWLSAPVWMKGAERLPPLQPQRGPEAVMSVPPPFIIKKKAGHDGHHGGRGRSPMRISSPR